MFNKNQLNLIMVAEYRSVPKQRFMVSIIVFLTESLKFWWIVCESFRKCLLYLWER